MADVAERRLLQIQLATHPVRWRLLTFATMTGPFEAAQAAQIAGLLPKSGNARTHAERLCSVDLLEREPGARVRYRTTPRGAALCRELMQVVTRSPDAGDAHRVLERGAALDLVAEVGELRVRKRPERVIFRITRER